MAITFENQVFHLRGETFSYVMKLGADGILRHGYWGHRLPDDSVAALMQDPPEGASFDRAESRIPYELPTQEAGFYRTPAVAVRNAQGDDVVALRYVRHEILAGKPALTGLPSSYAEDGDGAQTLIVTLADPLTAVEVQARYTVNPCFDVLARSVTVRNGGREAVTLSDVQSASVQLRGCAYDAIHLKGGWARERTVTRAPFCGAGMTVESRRGASGHEESPFLALCEPRADELSGRVYAMTLVYSGSFRALAESGSDDDTHLAIGLNPAVNTWRLSAGESFDAPEALLVFSDEGLNGMSRRFHEFIRLRICRGEWRDKPRPILINNWEGTYFDFTEEKLLTIARHGAAIGCELFVLDDGWFGKRNDDHCSLGDWQVNRAKLPNGLDGLSAKVHGLGMLFGLWFEPEMISPDSDAYRAHPDWCLHVTGRARSEARNQLILDMSRAEVQAYVLHSLCSVLDAAEIDYVKWDMNRNMTEAFSEALPPERRMETQHRYMLGLYAVLEALTKRYPHILFEGCSGGGGRFDCGMLCYMPQIWTSDDTDAMERTRIQYGTSFVYPPCTMGAHVSACPNHQTGRTTSLKARCDVAASGNFGFELDLSRFTAEEEQMAATRVAQVKSLRGVLQKGCFTRLESPFEGEYAAWMLSDETHAAVFAARTLAHPNPVAHRLFLRGLAETALYREQESGAVYSGAALMYGGYPVRLEHDFETVLLVFERVGEVG